MKRNDKGKLTKYYINKIKSNKKAILWHFLEMKKPSFVNKGFYLLVKVKQKHYSKHFCPQQT